MSRVQTAELQSGKPDLFDKYVDRDRENACDIEHIWADDYDRFKGIFPTLEEFYAARDHVAALLLLPADVNRSLQDKDYADKVAVYAGQNLYAASLSEAAYAHQPQFKAFRERSGLPFRPYPTFGKAEQAKRGTLAKALAKEIRSPARLEQALA